MSTKLDFVPVAGKSICYVGYLRESGIRTSRLSVPSLIFAKASDSIARPVMFRILRNYGVLDNVCKEISVLYCGNKSSVLVCGEMSGEFEVKIGVLQGDTLAPFIFVTVLDSSWCLQKVAKNQIRIALCAINIFHILSVSFMQECCTCKLRY